MIVGSVLERVLTRHCRATRTATVAQALVAIEAAVFSIVLSDFFLPDGDGAAVLRRASDVQPSALRLLMSGGEVEEAARWAKEGFIDGWLPKPFSNEAFSRVIRAIPRWGRPFGDSD